MLTPIKPKTEVKNTNFGPYKIELLIYYKNIFYCKKK